MLKIGSTYPLDILTLRKNSSGVFLIRSERKSRLMMESPREERKKICEIIIFYYRQTDEGIRIWVINCLFVQNHENINHQFITF